MSIFVIANKYTQIIKMHFCSCLLTKSIRRSSCETKRWCCWQEQGIAAEQLLIYCELSQWGKIVLVVCNQCHKQCHFKMQSCYYPLPHCTMCTLCSTMSLYLLWRCIWYNKKKGWIQGHKYGRRGGYSDIFWGNHRSRVWKSLKLKKVFFPRTQTSWDKYMFNRIVFFQI